MKYVSTEYQRQLDHLAETLCSVEPNLNAYAEVADVIIERPEIAQLGYTALNRWDSMGTYLEVEP